VPAGGASAVLGARQRTPEELRKAIAFLVVSYDGYSDLWNPYFELFHRFWPDCPLEVSLLTNHLEAPSSRVRTIKVGEDRSWSDNLLTALDRIEQPYLVLGIEDQFFVDRVDTTHANAIFNWVIDHEPNYLRLLPTPPPNGRYDDLVGIVAPGAVYRASTVYCIWKKSALRSVLRQGESAWSFEIDGGERSDRMTDFYAVWKACFPVSHAVVLGRWRRSEARLIRSLDVSIDTTRRPLMSPFQEFWFRVRNMRSMLFRRVPVPWSRPLRKFLQAK
jgi:hypothetical protein